MNENGICRCKQCGFGGKVDEFKMSLSPYHDMKCPECGTTAVDTSELNDGDYGYGDHNVLDTSKRRNNG